MLLVSILGCRGEQAGADDPTAGSDSAKTSAEATAQDRPRAGPQGDPFAGIEALRPEPWTGWPLENVDITTEAGWRIDPVSGKFEFEQALILDADAGAFVLAIAPGEVRELLDDADGDLELILDHGDGIESRYGPLSDALVHAGMPVTRGAAIGLARGKTLALTVTVDGVAIDPLLVMRQPLHRWPALLRSLPPPPPADASTSAG